MNKWFRFFYYKGTNMTKFLLILSASLSFFLPAYGEFRAREIMVFYSKDAPANVDQKEYNELAYQMLLFPNDEVAKIKLRKIGTPAALRLIEDLEDLEKQAKQKNKSVQEILEEIKLEEKELVKKEFQEMCMMVYSQ